MHSKYFQSPLYVEPSQLLDFQSPLEEEFYLLLADTRGLIGKLDGILQYVPNADFFTALMIRQEVCASCELENTSVRFYDFFEYRSNGFDLQDNMLSAMKYAQDTAFSESAIRTIHGILETATVAESEYRKNDGLSCDDIFRLHASQPIPFGWISAEIKDMANYISKVDTQYALVSAAKIQYQLEVLKPFNQYSKAIARMVAMLMIKRSGLVNHPALWISDYLRDIKIEYMDRIAATYKYEEGMLNILWGKFFITAVHASAQKAIHQIESLECARKKHMAMLPQISGGNKSVLHIYEFVANTVIVNIRQISDTLNLSFSSVSKVVAAFEGAGILRQVTQKERYRKFGYSPVLDLVEYT